MSDIYLTVSWQDASLDEVFTSLNEKTGFRFLYEERKIGKIKGVSLTANNQSLEGILKDLSVEKKLQFRRVNKTIAVQLFENLNDQNRVVELADVDITGKITDENGEGLPGASVIEKGTSNGTTTDLDGNFKLGLDEAATLVVSFVGYKTMEVAIAGRSTIDLQMELDAEQLEEVVVVGYGVQKKVNLTGSVESVSEEDIVSRPVGQASMALQGLAPGVTVTQNSGKPGSDGGVIRIRGIGTIGDSNPLVLVDGIPFNLNDVDVNEIESISVLKDAASAAIYGSRAANGVVLVTTKRAKTNQFSINYRASVGWQQPTELMQKVSGYDHMVMINEASRNVGQSEPFTQQYIDEYKASSPSDDYPETNWHDVMLKDRAFQQNQYVSINSGGDKISLLGSISFLDQDGIMHSDYQRVNYRINTDIKLKENIQFKLDMLGKTEGNEEPPQSWHWLARYPHNLAGLNEDGSWGIGWDGNNGWATMVDGGKSYDNTDDLVVNMKMDWQPFEGLNVGIQYAPNKSYRHYKSFRKHVNLFYPDGFVINPSPYKAQLTEQYTKTNSNNYKALVSYDKSIRDHSLAFLLGWEAIDYKSEWIRGFRDQYPLENYEVLNVGSTANQTANGSAAEWALMSYFSRVNYNFKEKYLFEANVRIDGSSRFAEGYKYGLFPSFSAGWRISEEAFMSDVSSTWLYNLKLRASWGRLGNQSIGNYPFASGVSTGLDYVFGNDSPALGAGLLNAANPQISWETTEMVNVGLDAGMGKFSITADYYIKNTYDILLRLPVPQIAGLSAPYQNAGKVRNKGWDFRVQFDDNVGELNYSIGANLSDVKNEVVDLVGTGPYIFERTAHFEGQPIDALYGLQSSGLFQNQSEVDSHASQFGPVSPGDIRYVDQSVDVDGDGLVDEPDGIVNASDRVVMGSTIPRYTYGLNLNFQYKGLDLGMFFQGVGKVDGYLDNFATQAFYLGGTAQEWHKDHWSENNPNAPYPRLTFNFPNNEQVSSYWVRSAAYFRMKNLQIGYSLPRKVIDKVSINKCRFFVSAQNLFTIDDFYNSFDPESPVGGGEFYPMVKVFVFGIETTF
ncbi:MAG: TonB-dependent receptor [Cyclobacteriaceae bacterium]